MKDANVMMEESVKHLKSDIKIFVSNRIDLNSAAFDNSLLIPVRCGAVYDERTDVEILGDNTGDNISEKRRSFCELTVQYWAWKNVTADYYGLFHYRRFLNFAKFRFPEDAYGSVVDKSIGKETQRIYGLNEDNMRSVIEKCDIVIPEPRDVSKFPEHPASVWEHWRMAKDLHECDLKILLNVIGRMSRDHYDTAVEYLHGTQAYFCAMYIMKAEIFRAYCEWLYPILFELEREIDISLYTEEGQRTVGHLAERLLGIYITYLKKTKPELRIRELQTVLFLEPEKKVLQLGPAFGDYKDKTIPIVFAASQEFAPVCSVAINSILRNSNPAYYYDIIVLESDISDNTKRILKDFVSERENVSIRFFNVVSATNGYDLVANEHITVETYYRFLIQDILPDYDKVLYLDGDIVCNRDVSTLYFEDVTGYLLAAAHDPDLVGQIRISNFDMLNYLVKELKMENPYDYFQAGVLLLNIKEMRKMFSTQQWLTFASHRYKYSDQDVLNRYCQGKVKYLNMAWNTLIDCNHYRVPIIIKAATGQIYQEYQIARKNPYIIHYAGFEKPWKQRNVDFEYEFWKYARETPFYEELLLNVIKSVVPQDTSGGHPPTGVKGAVKNYIRKKADKYCPRGTRRRAILGRLFGWIVK